MPTELAVAALTPGSREWLEQAVTISLFTDARLLEPAPLPDGDDRMGYWGDLFLPADESLGSLLWTLRREKLTSATINRARDLATTALRWLLETPYVTGVQVQADRVEPLPLDLLAATWTLALRITISLPSGESFPTTELLNGAA